MYRHWLQKGVRYVRDLMTDDKKSFLTLIDFKNKFNLQCNVLHYYGLLRANPQYWKRKIFSENQEIHGRNYPMIIYLWSQE